MIDPISFFLRLHIYINTLVRIFYHSIEDIPYTPILETCVFGIWHCWHFCVSSVSVFFVT